MEFAILLFIVLLFGLAVGYYFGVSIAYSEVESIKKKTYDLGYKEALESKTFKHVPIYWSSRDEGEFGEITYPPTKE